MGTPAPGLVSDYSRLVGGDVRMFEFILLHTDMIRVILPHHLRTLAHVRGDVDLDVDSPITQRSVLDALEARYPMLRGTIRDQVTGSAGRS